MGLTESNHSKATTGCTGPSKSRSTPHFPDSRGYQNRPRQAATLPARPTPDSSQTPPYHHPRTPVRDPQPIGHDPRPPETERSYRDGFVQVGRSPSFRPVAPRRSASADSRKRRSDPLLDAKTFKQLPEMVSFQQQPAHVSLSHSRVSPPTSPRSNPQRPRPTAIYVADDQPTRLVKTREGRSRDRGSNGSKSRNPPKAETRDRSRGSRERRQRTTHVSTFTMTPHCPENSPLHASHETPPVSHQRHKKTRHRSGQRAEFTAPDNPQGDPYVCLHYGGTMRNGQRKPIQQVAAWRTEQEEEEPPSPNRQMSQVVIHMNQVTATTLDNYDALNANIESVQVRRNVWFQASRAIGSASESPMVRKISSKAMRTPSICETTSGYDNSEIIRWPDVTNKVSSIYMRPEMNFADVSRSAREQKGVRNNGDSSSVCQGSNRISVGSCDHRCAVNRPAKDNTVASMYQVSYSKRTENKGVYVSDSAEEQYVHDGDWDYCRNREKNAKSFASTSEIRKKRGVAMPSQDEILPPLEFSEGSCMQSSTNGDVYHSSFVSEEEQERGRDDHVNKKKMEWNFGINNHVEDYTIIEDATNEARFYGCRDSDQENDESPSFAACDSLLSGIGQPSSLTNKDMPVECSDTLDNISLVNDKADKEPATDDGKIPFVDNSLFALRVSEQLPESFIVQGNGTSIKTYDDAPLSKTWNERDLDNFYKEQISLVTDYLSLRDPCLCKGKEEKSDIYEKVVDHPGGSYPAATVPGSPSALAFSQKCLTQSSSLPRHLQCVSRSAATDSGNIDSMKAFRNRFRSFDLGRFPVLRLPLGNQPRLIDVLRANPSGSQEQKSNVSQGKVNDESSDTSDNAIHHIAEDDVNEVDGASSSVVRDPLVSYMDCYSPQESGQKDEAVDPGEISPVPCDIGALSINSSGNDRIRTQSCPDAQRLPNDHDSQNEECLSDEGCGVGTIMRGAIPDLNGANTYVVPCDVPLSLRTNPTLHDHRDRSESGNDGTGVRSGDHEEENEVVTGSRNTWQAEEGNGHVRSHRWSNGMVEDGARLSPDGVTLRHPEKAVLLRSDKRRAVSDCTHPLRSSSHRNPPCVVPDIIPPFNKHVRRKPPTNRTSLHSIDWDTPLPPPVALNTEEPDCSYTCHEQCQDLVTLDCKTDLTPDSNTSEEDLYVDTDQGTLVKHEHLSNQNLSITVTSQEEEAEEEEDYQEEQEEKHEEEQQEKELLEEPYRWNEEVSTLRKSVNRLQSHLVDNETLEAWVEKYNATSQGLQIAKENDGSYRGCIRVHLNLSRPINIVAGTRPPSIYDILQEDRTMEKTLTSFYMPRDAVKAIHITSKTTTREVIIALLRKFKVVDNPQKFALYERTYDTGQPGKAKLRRLGDSECPLVLAINWSAGGLTNKRLVLQENDTADIQWEAFSLPELSNFLRILDREEEEYRCQIKDKYALLRRRIGNMLIQTSVE